MQLSLFLGDAILQLETAQVCREVLARSEDRRDNFEEDANGMQWAKRGALCVFPSSLLSKQEEGRIKKEMPGESIGIKSCCRCEIVYDTR